MKIVICNHDYRNYVSGPNVWLLRLIDEFQKKGIECVVLFTRGRRGNQYRTVTSLEERKITTYTYNGLKYAEHKIRWILEIVNKENPDIFIPNLDISAYYATGYIHRAGIPTVGILHSDDPYYRALIDEFLKKENTASLSAFVCVSRLLQELCEATGNQNVKISRIPYGVPMPETPARFDEEKLRIVYAGRLVEKQKRISDVTHALCKMVDEVPGTEAILYGSGAAESDVRNIIKMSGAGQKVKMGGLVDPQQLLDKYCEAQVFVLLSDYEGLPISLLEAMGCGLVPVCLNMDSGIPELIDHNRTGLLVNDRGQDFVNAIHRIKNEEGLLEKLSAGARDQIEQTFSMERCAEKWIGLFKDLIGSNPLDRKPIEIPETVSLPDGHPVLKKSERRWKGYTWHYCNNVKERLQSILKRIKQLND
jgi:colanic acid/amylovoran biosynthesis glycosyltransferase